MRKLSLVTSVAVVVGAGYGAARWGREPAARKATAHDERLVKDRMWIDHLPQHDRDRINVFAALTQRPRQGPGPVGIFEKIGPWEGHFEAFRYESQGDEMRIMFPQSGDRETLHVKAVVCNDRGFDYCLEVEGSTRGVKQYYSRKGWEVRDAHDIETLSQSLVK